MRARPFVAIVAARLYAELGTIEFTLLAALLVGMLAPQGLAGPIAFCCLAGIAVALAASPGRRPHLDHCEQSAPLFGRELARAKASAPCIAAVLTATAYLGAAQTRGGSGTPFAAPVVLSAVVACTLVALCAAIRRGLPRALYLGVAVAAGAAAYSIAAVAGCVWGELLFCAVAAFFAVRQYGEALARYDPM
ncbi:MAG: hypothetical protein JO078_02405 [Candidatus Eremiobacteraeota bacterium]|nr:hypothetical protein [Candidatus Eremiobacteraeota bacterium]MBV9055281.1 hypothetical protein [Candidatus Eremiobacteraeota bacterium]MBV9698955.1 hypothetical protein [Candidatus Eremiobacteraeota bacterium]